MEIQKKTKTGNKAVTGLNPASTCACNREPRGAGHSSPAGWRLLLAALLLDGPRWRGGEGTAASTATAA
jgi:hypothetical protein